MQIPNFIKHIFPHKTQPSTRSATSTVRAFYDAASVSSTMNRHFLNADGLDPNQGLRASGRKLIASRARYEVANNGYANRTIKVLVSDTIGNGPKINVICHSSSAKDNITNRWREWTERNNLRQILATARRSKAVDGEVFLVLNKNPKIPHFPYKLSTIEADYICDTAGSVDETYPNGQLKHYDGINLDQYGEPTGYTYIPPTSYASSKPIVIGADLVIHYANLERPGQIRGVSEMASTLINYNDLRRYSNAVLSASELAACLSFLVESGLPPSDDSDGWEAGTTMDVYRGGGTVLPEGYSGKQLKAEQPTSTYSDYTKAKIRECAGCFGMPLNVALGDSSGYNYASGRLDHQSYHKLIRVERKLIEEVILFRLFELFKIVDRIKHPADYKEEVRASFMWDAFGHVDPVKEANAQATRLANFTANISTELAADGRDFADMVEQRAKEIKLLEASGLPIPEFYKKTEAMLNVANPDQEDGQEPEPTQA